MLFPCIDNGIYRGMRMVRAYNIGEWPTVAADLNSVSVNVFIYPDCVVRRHLSPGKPDRITPHDDHG